MKNLLLALLFLFGFTTVIQAQKPLPKTCPCCQGSAQDFAFWIGEWQVYDSTGTKLLGNNSISFVQDSCVMKEEWASATSAYTGTSYNFYDTSNKEWRQLWIDNQGGSLDLKGGLDEQGRMILKSEDQIDSQGKKYTNRIIWTALEDGRVQQLWQSSYDEGTTWKNIFNGYYQRK